MAKKVMRGGNPREEKGRQGEKSPASFPQWGKGGGKKEGGGSHLYLKRERGAESA